MGILTAGAVYLIDKWGNAALTAIESENTEKAFRSEVKAHLVHNATLVIILSADLYFYMKLIDSEGERVWNYEIGAYGGMTVVVAGLIMGLTYCYCKFKKKIRVNS